jgi:hypothetical protein
MQPHLFSEEFKIIPLPLSKYGTNTKSLLIPAYSITALTNLM